MEATSFVLDTTVCEGPPSKDSAQSYALGDALRRSGALVGNHGVGEDRVVPAATIAYIVCELRGSPGEVHLCGLGFHRPITEEDITRARLEVHEAQQGNSQECAFEIRLEGNLPAVTGRIVRRRAVGALTLPSAPANASQKKLLPDQFYEALAQRGNHYGPALRLIRGLDISDFAGDRFIRAIVQASEPQAMLDGCLHTALAADGHSEPNAPWLIGSIEAVHISAAAFQGSVVCCARVREDPGCASLVADLSIHDENGVCIGEVRSVTFRRRVTRGADVTLQLLSNFTVEPLRQAIDVFGRDLGIAARAAPHDQVVQQLQSMSSHGASGGEVVLLLQLSRWWSARSLQRGEAFRQAVEAGAIPRRLPNGLEVLELNGYETDYLYKEIFDDRTYLVDGIDLRLNDVVLDVGANIGMFSLHILSLLPDARVYAFEPSPVTAKVLRANLESRGAVTVLECGLADRIGSASFAHYERSTVFSGFRAEKESDERALHAIVANALGEDSQAAVEGGLFSELMSGRLHRREFEVQLTSLSHVIEEHELEEIGLLKIDAEKSELAILRGISEEHWPRIRQIVIEVHEQSSAEAQLARAILESRGFEVRSAAVLPLAGSGLSLLVARRPGARPLHTAQPNCDTLGLRAMVDALVDAIRSFRQSSVAPITVVVTPELGAIGDSAAVRREHQSRLEHLKQGCEPYPGVRVLEAGELESLYDLPAVGGEPANIEAGMPYSDEWYAAAGAWLVRDYARRNRRPHKVIIVDCDDTLWCGSCAELGAKGVSISHANRLLQQWLVRMRGLGFLVCLASKNVPEDVLEVFTSNPEMALGLSDIATHRICWDDKVSSISSLVDELGLSLDSAIFLDNDPVECALVRARLPQVLVLQVPSSADEMKLMLRHTWAFDVDASGTVIDRTLFYRAESERRRIRKASSSHAHFLESLRVEVAIAKLDPRDLDRALELVRRTNQFNVNPVHQEVPRVRARLCAPDVTTFAVRVKDRFGDYGLVGLISGSPGRQSFDVDTFLLSCRALARGVEQQMLRHVVRYAADCGLTDVRIQARKTARNEPAQRFLAALTPYGRWLDDSSLQLSVDALSHIELRDYCIEGTAAEPERVDPSSAPISMGRLNDRYRDGAWLHVNARRTSTSAALVACVWPTAAPASALSRATSTELDLATLWSSVLGSMVRSPDDDFFALGGSSLMLVRVLNQVRSKWKIAVSLGEAYAHPTLAALAKLIDARRHLAARSQPEDLAVHATERDLSSAEAGIWFEYLKDPSSASYVVPIALRLTTRVEPERLERALRAVSLNHDVLRTVYQLRGERSVACIRQESAVEWIVVNALNWSEEDVAVYLRSRAAEPIDVSDGPVVSADFLIRATESILLLRFHHISMDLQSLSIVIEELSACCADRVEQPGEKLSYNAFVRRERTPEMHALQQRSDLPERSARRLWPAISDNPNREPCVSRTRFLSAACAGELAKAARELSTTRSVMLLATYALFLKRETGQEVMVVGTPVSLRQTEAEAAIVGNFTNLLPLHIDLRDCEDLRGASRAVRDAMSIALMRQHIPLQDLVAEHGRSRARESFMLETLLTLHESSSEIPVSEIFSSEDSSTQFCFAGVGARFWPLIPRFAAARVCVHAFDSGERLGLTVVAESAVAEIMPPDFLAERYATTVSELLSNRDIASISSAVKGGSAS